MRKLMLAAAMTCAAIVAGCSDAQVAATNAALDRYDHALDNFNAAAARVDKSMVKTSATVAPYCSSAVAVGTNVGRIVKGDDTAATALDALTTGLNTYCAAPPQDVAGAVVFLSQAIADGQAAIKKHGSS